MQATRVWLEQLEAGLGTEAGTDPSVQLAYLAGVDVLLEAEDEEVRGALRRAVLLLAAGGDPQRALEV
nr:hypothetical protein [Actinomycetota bacterium]